MQRSKMSDTVRDKRVRFYMVDNALLTEHGEALGPYGIAVYNALCMYAGRKDRCFPGQATVAKLTGMSPDSVQRSLSKLVELGLVSVTNRTGTSNEYEIRGVPLTAVGGTAHSGTNNTHLTRSYMEDSPNLPDPPTGVEEIATPRESTGVWESTKGQPLRSRCLATIRAANEQLTASGKPDPRAKASALRTIYLSLFGDTYPPEIPRLMKLAGQSGGPERLVLRMLEASTREVVGNPHDLLTRWKTDKGASTPSGYSPWDNVVN